MTVPKKHQLRIAKKTLTMTCMGARILGGMDHVEAVRCVNHHGGAVSLPSDCRCEIKRLIVASYPKASL